MTTVQLFLKPKFGAISLGDISQKGKARIAPIHDAKGKPIKLVLSKAAVLRTPWQVSSFDGGDRCSLDIVLTEELEALCSKIDDAVRGAVEKDPNRYFKGPLKEDWYKPLKKEPSKEGYASTMRTKLTIGEERCSFKCWDADKNPMSIGQIKALHWPTTAFAAAVSLKGAYFQSNSYGPLLEVDMLMVKPEDAECPFGGGEDDSSD